MPWPLPGIVFTVKIVGSERGGPDLTGGHVHASPFRLPAATQAGADFCPFLPGDFHPHACSTLWLMPHHGHLTHLFFNCC